MLSQRNIFPLPFARQKLCEMDKILLPAILKSHSHVYCSHYTQLSQGVWIPYGYEHIQWWYMEKIWTHLFFGSNWPEKNLLWTNSSTIQQTEEKPARTEEHEKQKFFGCSMLAFANMINCKSTARLLTRWVSVTPAWVPKICCCTSKRSNCG